MGRLKMAKPRLGVAKGRLMRASTSEGDRSRHRDDTQVWRHWYKTARWQKLRLKILIGDLYTCQATGVALVGKYPAANSAVVDHIIPHRGDPLLFWDETNLRAVSKTYHDGEKQSMEKRGLV